MSNFNMQRGGRGGFNPNRGSVEPDSMIPFRFLIPSKAAGIIIGHRGERIQKLMHECNCRLSIPDNRGPERLLLIDGTLESCIRVWSECFPDLKDIMSAPSRKGGNEMDLRFLCHTSLVGTVIGKAGSKVKEMRTKYQLSLLKVHTDMAPQSTDRVIQIIGPPDKVYECIKVIFTDLEEQTIRGPVEPYNPENHDDKTSMNYGGWPPEGGWPLDEGGFMPPFEGPPIDQFDESRKPGSSMDQYGGARNMSRHEDRYGAPRNPLLMDQFGSQRGGPSIDSFGESRNEPFQMEQYRGRSGPNNQYGDLRDEGSMEQFARPRNLGPQMDQYGGTKSSGPPIMDQYGGPRNSGPPLLDQYGAPRTSGHSLPDQYGGSRNSGPPLLDQYGGQRNSGPPLLDQYGGPRNSGPPLLDQYGGPRNSGPPLLDQYGGPRNSGPPLLNQYGGPRNSGSPIRDQFGEPSNPESQMMDQFGEARCGPPPDQYRGSRSGHSQDQFGGSRNIDHYGGPLMNQRVNGPQENQFGGVRNVQPYNDDWNESSQYGKQEGGNDTGSGHQYGVRGVPGPMNHYGGGPRGGGPGARPRNVVPLMANVNGQVAHDIAKSSSNKSHLEERRPMSGSRRPFPEERQSSLNKKPRTWESESPATAIISKSQLPTLSPGDEVNVTIPAEYLSALQGVGGEKLYNIMEDSGANIVVKPDDDLCGERIITVKGTKDQIEGAQYLMQMCIKRCMLNL